MLNPSNRANAATRFRHAVKDTGRSLLKKSAITTLQLNLGRRCNQSCAHCHVEAGPLRTEMMSTDVVERIHILLGRSPAVTTVDLTGGAPELHPLFKSMVSRFRGQGRRVIDRCNLTVLFEPGCEDLAEFLAAESVEVTASLPCYTQENVDQQRGTGVFNKSIRGLQTLNALGYGRPGTGLNLNLVYNPGGPFLPGAQADLEAAYKDQLGSQHGIVFNRLLTITNMPINRFADQLGDQGESDAYFDLLVEAFNPQTVDGIMCRSMLSIGWDGRLYDCDFNQVLELGLDGQTTRIGDIFQLESFGELDGSPIATGEHCFGCTAGAGSSCGGALK